MSSSMLPKYCKILIIFLLSSPRSSQILWVNRQCDWLHHKNLGKRKESFFLKKNWLPSGIIPTVFTKVFNTPSSSYFHIFSQKNHFKIFNDLGLTLIFLILILILVHLCKLKCMSRREQALSSMRHTLSDHSFVGKLHHILLLLALVSLPASSSGTKEF
jgi:hypothetical protein